MTSIIAPQPPRSRSAAYWRPRDTPAHAEFRAARDLLLARAGDHDAACAEFRWPRPRHFNWALEWFDVIAAQRETPALILLDDDGRGTSIGFARLAARSDAVAVWLTTLGVRRGDRVLIALDQRRELWETILGCLKIGAVVIPTYASLTPAEARDRLDRGAVRHIVCESRLAGLFPPAEAIRTRIAVGVQVAGWHDYRDSTRIDEPFLPQAPTPADDIAFCYFTSGTTSAPKLVAHSHASYPIGHLSSMYWSGLRPGDRHLNVSAPGWAKHSWSSLFAPWNAEATIVALPPGPTPVSSLPELLLRHGVSSFCAPPSTWRSMLDTLASARPPLREALSAGEPLDEQVSAAVHAAWGVEVRDGYGQTETTGLIGTTPGMPRRPGWLGKPLPGYRIWLRDPQTGEPATHGEVCVDLASGPIGVMHGYLTPAGETTLPAAGVFPTGDLGEQDPDGWIRIDGRRDDVFKSFDRRVSPYELEAVLRDHPAVADAAVVPRPHPIGGAVAHAVVELADPNADSPALRQELLSHVDARVAPELRVHSVQVCARLPRTGSGKVRRGAVRAELNSEPTDIRTVSSGGSTMSATNTQQRNVTVLTGLLTADGRDAVAWDRWVEPGRAGVDIHRLYRNEPAQATAFLVRFGPGAHGDLHEHLDFELMFVLDGDLHNDNGDRYGVGDLIIEEPNSIHRVSSTGGCTLLVVREAPTRPLPDQD